MTPSPEDLAAQYAQMSETELMELAHSYDGLLEIARVALRTEFARRGLEPPLVEEPEEWELRRLVTVRRYRDLVEAYVGRSLLESAGISAWIADEHLVRMDWFYSNMVGGMRLQVEERDEADAREILKEGAPGTIISSGRGGSLYTADLPKVRIGRDYPGRRDRARAVICGSRPHCDSSAATRGGLALRGMWCTVGGCGER